MLLVFPLFPGFSGYGEITLSKFCLFAGVTVLWLASLAVLALMKRAQLSPLQHPQVLALVYLGVCILSWLLSEHRAESLLGAGRYDGLATTALYMLGYFAVSRFGSLRLRYVSVLAISAGGCALVALLQLGGGNPLGLFPGDLSYFDAGIRYSGAFLGTIGNTNLLDAFVCLTLPMFAALVIFGYSRLFVIPIALQVPYLLKAGGDGGRLALAVTAALALPLLLTEREQIVRALRLSAVMALCAAAALCWQPAARQALRFVFAPAALRLCAAAAVFVGVSLLLPQLRRFPDKKRLQRIWLAVIALALLCFVAAALLHSGESGTLYELGQLLRGHAEDSFGSSRIGIWRACLALVPKHPLLGSGPGTAALGLDIRFSRYVPETGETLRSFVDNAHSFVLAALVNTGVLGLITMLLPMVTALIPGLRQQASPLHRAAALGCICCAVQELFGLYLVITAPLLWLMLGLLAAPINHSLEETT